RERTEAEAVDEARLRRRRQLRQHRSQPREVGLVQSVAVDVARGDRAHDDLLRARDDGAEQLLPAFLAALLRVVEVREPAHLVLLQRTVVEQYACDDERPGERSAPRLVRAG